MSSSQPSLDAAGRRRSPATRPGARVGVAPPNKGQRYPADPPPVDEIVAVMRQAADTRHGHRVRALIVVLWRAGLRIQEALSLTETDLDPRRGSVLVRHGLCRTRHRPCYAGVVVMPSSCCRVAGLLVQRGVELGITSGVDQRLSRNAMRLSFAR